MFGFGKKEKKPLIVYDDRDEKAEYCRCTHLVSLHNFMNVGQIGCLLCKCPKADPVGEFTFDEFEKYKRQNLPSGKPNPTSENQE